MERDEESGLSYHNARYYIPWLGRWLSPDPIGLQGGMNLYCYCDNAPIGLIDVDGHLPAGALADQAARRGAKRCGEKTLKTFEEVDAKVVEVVGKVTVNVGLVIVPGGLAIRGTVAAINVGSGLVKGYLLYSAATDIASATNDSYNAITGEDIPYVGQVVSNMTVDKIVSNSLQIAGVSSESADLIGIGAKTVMDIGAGKLDTAMVRREQTLLLAKTENEMKNALIKQDRLTKGYDAEKAVVNKALVPDPNLKDWTITAGTGNYKVTKTISGKESLRYSLKDAESNMSRYLIQKRANSLEIRQLKKTAEEIKSQTPKVEWGASDNVTIVGSAYSMMRSAFEK